MDMPIESELDPIAERGARDAAALLEELGHEVEEVEAPWKGADLLPTFSVLWAANVAASAMHGAIVTGRQLEEGDIEPLSWWLYTEGMNYKAPEYIGAVVALQSFSRGVMALWDQHDLVLTPALAQRPVRHGQIDAMGENPSYEFLKSGQFTPYTAPFNVSGQPAISVPLYQGEDGLPVAVQLGGPQLGEGLLLQVCRQLEEARPWADRLPPEPARATA